MARKQLIAGSNARRLEDRISRVPPDIRDEGGIFRELRMREETDDLAKADDLAKTEDVPAPRSAQPASLRPPAKTPPKYSAPAVARMEEKPDKNKGPRSAIPFTRHERELISKCCVEYRNHLPIYLKSVRHEVSLLESIIRKCADE